LSRNAIKEVFIPEEFKPGYQRPPIKKPTPETALVAEPIIKER